MASTESQGVLSILPNSPISPNSSGKADTGLLRFSRVASALVLMLGLGLGCTRIPAPSSDGLEPPASSRSGSLLRLADEALQRGEADVARKRYERVIAYDSRSGHALQGLARLALLEGRPEEARGLLERAIRSEPDSVLVHLALADLEAQTGDVDAARAALETAVRLDSSNAVVHQQYLDLTGRAPRLSSSSTEEAIAIADRHPYDPRARLAVGRRLAREGRTKEAISHLATAVWLTDLNPNAGRLAFEALADLDSSWAARRLVFVYVVADEAVRKTPGWKFRLRNHWLFASKSLAPLIDTWFVPRTIGEISLANSTDSLDVMMDIFRNRVGGPSTTGIAAAFTGRPVPRLQGAKLGLAEFLGRRLIVRLPPDERQSRVLVHELLHLYGGVHVADGIDSIMNRAAGSFKLDPLNQGIVGEMRERGFRDVGFDRNVSARVDVSKSIEAYMSAINANLTFRKMGVIEALDARSTSRFIARDKLDKARKLDPHLGDVMRVVAKLLVADERPAEGLRMLEVAAVLYGRDTQSGKQMIRQANSLRRQLERTYGVGSGKR